MKLLKLLFFPLSALLLYACQDDENVRPVTDQANSNVLGLVVPHANSDGQIERILFLNDGRRVSPVSGIPNFNETEFGSKLLVSFQPKKMTDGILKVSVTSFSEAEDSTFTPSDTVFIPGDSIFTPIDSVFVPPVDTVTNPGDSINNPPDSSNSIIIYKGTFVILNTDSTSGNPYQVSDTLTLTLDGRNFNCVTTDNFPLGGSGTFVVTPAKIKFKDNHEWPEGTDHNLVLDGWFTYYIDESGSLSLYAIRDGIYISYYLQR